MKRRSSETEGDSDVQKISKRSCSASSEVLEVEESLPEGLDSRGLDSEHPFYRDALVIIPRIDSGDEELQNLAAATTSIVCVNFKPLQAEEKKSYDNAMSRNLSNLGLDRRLIRRYESQSRGTPRSLYTLLHLCMSLFCLMRVLLFALGRVLT
jgi:hypothetical protein